MNEIRDPKVELVNEYFRRSDAGRADVTDLFTDDVEIYFPKFGIERGKSAYLNLAKGLLSYLSALAHHFHSFKYVVSGNVAVVEGTTYGRTKDCSRGAAHLWCSPTSARRAAGSRRRSARTRNSCSTTSRARSLGAQRFRA